VRRSLSSFVRSVKLKELEELGRAMQVVRINFCLKFNHEKEVLEVSFLVRRKG
jgi:hypothetical protein